MSSEVTYTAFAGERLIVSGDLKTVLLRTKKRIERGDCESVLIFEDQTGQQIDFDFRGAPEEVLGRLPEHPLFKDREGPLPVPRGPGRPRLGVVGREVTLLPRHWAWLEQQPGGISVTLRKLVEEARKSGQGRELARRAREAAEKFMWVMAGNLPNFEEACRALGARDQARLQGLIRGWPEDIRRHVERLVGEHLRLEALAEKEGGLGKKGCC